MSSLGNSPTVDSTSAAGAMSGRQVPKPVTLVGCLLVGLVTSPGYDPGPNTELRAQLLVAHTTAGAAVVLSQPTGAAISALRRLSGLTWDQLARLFNVSRRSLHFWASGKPLAPSNEEHLQRLLSVVRKIDRGSASATRAVLLGVREDGSFPFDLLAAGHYERVLALLGQGEIRRATLPKVSEEAGAARTPRPPEELVSALQDRIHPTSGRLLAVKAVAVSRRK